jgi:predicted cupin superfamily sugar epimerase
MPDLTAEDLIEMLDLVPLEGEGGLFRRSYLSADVLAAAHLPPRYRSDKPAGSAIYYLLTDNPDSFSALHRLPTDEIYHFYLGDPVELFLLVSDSESRMVILGQDIPNDQHVQFTVPAWVWQGSRLREGGRFALMGTTMAPGYTDDDYQPGYRQALQAEFPEQAALIKQLTRE